MRETGAVLPRLILVVVGIGWGVPVPAVGGSNLVAIDDLARMPDARATGRDSFAGDVIHFSFDDPSLDFGRVVVRTAEPHSVVRRDLFVGYSGGELVIDARNDTGRVAVNVEGVEIWFRLRGRLNSSGLYEWEMMATGSDGAPEVNFPASMPLFWADGEQCGAQITITPPSRPTDGRVQRMHVPRGEVRLHAFERQTGVAWVVLRPAGFGGRFAVSRCVFRELGEVDARSMAEEMPLPVAYVPLRSAVDRQVDEAIARGAEALLAARSDEGPWPGTDAEERIRNTAVAASAVGDALGAGAVPASALEWLAGQVLDQPARWRTETVAARLSCLARFGSFKPLRGMIHSDIRALSDAQADNGGWTRQRSTGAPGGYNGSLADHAVTSLVLEALQNARLAGAIVNTRLWRRAMQYWTEAQMYEGGYGRQLERYGGLGDAPSEVGTARGAATLMASLDMAAGVGGRHCTTYLSSSAQLDAIEAAIGWLETHHGEPQSRIGVVAAEEGAYERAFALKRFRTIFGIVSLNGEGIFEASARDLLLNQDRERRMFGVREGEGWREEPSVWRTAQAVSLLASGRAPTVCQRIVVGGDARGFDALRGDLAHLMHVLRTRRGEGLNWRRASFDQPARALLDVPLLLVTVVGPADWTTQHWRTLRAYCLAGGTVVIDIDDGASGQRAVVTAGLRSAFPEFQLRTLTAEQAVLSGDVRLAHPPPMSVMGNGFREFLFLAGESWSCQWQLFNTDAVSLEFMSRLLDYVTDGDPARRLSTGTTWSQGAVASSTMTAAHVEVGGDRPVYPDLLASLDRILRDHYRLAVEADDEHGLDLVWISVVGDRPPTAAAARHIRDALADGALLFVDIVSGEPAWDAAARGWLEPLIGTTFTRLRGTDPVLTGNIPGTRGFDAVEVALRPALHRPYSNYGRCALYALNSGGRRVGLYSADDISSGIGNHIFPGCRGAMPQPARELAMNVVLVAYEQKLRRQRGAAAQSGGLRP